MDRVVVVGSSTKASDQNYSTHEVADADYIGLDTDKFDEILMAATGANRDYTFPDPTSAENIDRIIIVRNTGIGAYKVTLNPFGAEKIIVYSGNEAWELTSFELLQAGDWAAFKSDGTNWVKINTPYWHKFDDPATGIKASKLDVWTIDDFSAGLEVTFSEGPNGILAVRCQIGQTNQGEVYYRKSGDTNISNTPAATQEYSHMLAVITTIHQQQVLWLSDDFKVQFTVSVNNVDLYIRFPIEYYQ